MDWYPESRSTPGVAGLPLAPWLSVPVTAAEGGELGLEAEAGALLT